MYLPLHWVDKFTLTTIFQTVGPGDGGDGEMNLRSCD